MTELSTLAESLADRYRIEREIGAGGMATVFLARDLKHDRNVAIKVLRREIGDAVGAERFLLEIKTTANLRHPHIVPLYDSGNAGGLLYYVMPLVEGESLRDRLTREKQLPIEDALRIARETADALSYAHAHGVIHRDIKPENILLEDGHAVIADFGIARALNAAGGERLTQSGMAVGTPQYMSPEQAAGNDDVDGRSDLYSLACVLYEMIGGQAPFTGPSAMAISRQHIVADAPPITNLRPAVPPSVVDALQRALSKSPADRFNPVAQFANAITVAAITTSAPERLSSHRTSPHGATKQLRVMPFVAVGLSFVAVIAAFFAIQRQSASDGLPVIGRNIQITRDPGLEIDAAVSPNGQFVAFARGSTTNMHIYVQQISGGRATQLTSDSANNNRWPRWSPDGSRIAYQTTDGVYVVPALGGAPRLVAKVPIPVVDIDREVITTVRGIDWSPDGKQIAYQPIGDSLFIVNVDGGATRALHIPNDAHEPAWSPDGTQIAMASGNSIFIYGTVYFANAGSASLWIIPIDGGPARQLTGGDAMDASPQWNTDGRSLLFTSDRGGSRDVYRLSVRGNGKPERVTTGLDAQTITLSRDGTRLAYSRLQSSSNIWSVHLPSAPATQRGVPQSGASQSAPMTAITTGRQNIEAVDVTRDGKWLVYDSDRNGNADIYKQQVSGGEPMPLTTDSTGDFSAAWSPDGARIAFHSMRSGGVRQIYTMHADGSGLQVHTRDEFGMLDPSWRSDGKAVIAEHLRPARDISTFEIIAVDGSSSNAFRVPAVGDFADWSPDGSLIAYHSTDGLRVIAPDGLNPRLLVSNAADSGSAYYAAWSSDSRTLYYLSRGATGWSIRAIPTAGGASHVVMHFNDPARQPLKYGFATDGKMFYLTMGAHESDVWVLELAKR